MKAFSFSSNVEAVRYSKPKFHATLRTSCLHSDSVTDRSNALTIKVRGLGLTVTGVHKKGFCVEVQSRPLYLVKSLTYAASTQRVNYEKSSYHRSRYCIEHRRK